MPLVAARTVCGIRLCGYRWQPCQRQTNRSSENPQRLHGPFRLDRRTGHLARYACSAKDKRMAAPCSAPGLWRGSIPRRATSPLPRFERITPASVAVSRLGILRGARPILMRRNPAQGWYAHLRILPDSGVSSLFLSTGVSSGPTCPVEDIFHFRDRYLPNRPRLRVS